MDARRLPIGLRLELAGPPRIVLADGSTLPLEPHDAALLAVVAVDGPVGRDRLAALVWPACSRTKALGNLRQRLFRLRRDTGLALAGNIDGFSLSPAIGHDLDPDAASSEAFLGDLRFEWSDELGDWVEGVRERRRRLVTERLAAEASRLEDEGRLAEAIELAERLLEREPALEHAHRRAMRLHYRRGDRAAALLAYQRCRASLDRVLGVAPSTETEALAALVERSGALPGPSPAPPPIDLLRPPRLIGREAVWSAWAAARRQPGRRVVISGEPGIGKSRLLEDFCAAHDLGAISTAHQGDARMPYTTWARWLRDWRARFGPPASPSVDAELARMVPGIGDSPSATFAPLRFRNACFDALTGWFERGLVAVTIDDLQYADDASLETLLAWCSETPLQGVALAVRSTETPAALVDWLDAHRGRGRLVEIAIGAFDAAATADLIESLDAAAAAGGAGELAHRTGGNPLFVLELLRAARRPDGGFDDAAALGRAPARLERLLSRRLEALPPDALQLARLAGLAGTDFSAALAAATLGVPPIALVDAWVVLERLQIFRNGTFAHDLMRECAAALVPDALAKPLHGAIARALDPAQVPAARIAHHALEADDWAFAAVQLETAAAEAFAAVRHREVVRFFDLAGACHTRLGNAGAALRVGCLAIDSALHVENESSLDARTAALGDAATDEVQELAAGIARIKHLAAASRTGELIPVAQRSLQLARRRGDPASELRAASLLAHALCKEGRPQEGIDLLREPAARYEAMTDSIERSDFAGAYANALAFCGRAAEAEPWSERGLADGERLGRAADMAVQWGTLAMIRWQLGRIDAGVAAGRRAFALHAQSSADGGATPLYAWVVLGNLLKRVGEWGEAEGLLEKSLTAARSHLPQLLPICENQLATLYLELGQNARARQALVTPPTRASTLLRRAVIVERLDARAGRRDGGERLAALMNEHRFGEGGMVFDRLANRLALAIVSTPEAAIAICRDLRVEAEALGSRTVSVAAAARLASASHEAGLHDDALQWGRLAWAESRSAAPYDMDAPELAWHVTRAVSNGAGDEALAIARLALDHVRDSLPKVPSPYRDAYWHRSPFVPRLRALLARG